MDNIPIKIVAMPTEVAAAVRHTGKSPRYGHPAHTEVATGYGPCRHCLQAFVKGAEQRVLFTYSPFDRDSEIPQPGPIFIHANECERYPEDGGYPESLRQYASVIDGYGPDQRLLCQVRVEDGEQPAAIQRIFENPDVRYAHVRDRNAGCFDFRVERSLT
jgi:hypothetical protein